MMGRKIQLRICTVLLILNLAFIWGNSLMPAEASQAFSDWMMSVLGSVPVEQAPEAGSGVLRKIAHFAEFAALGFLLAWLFALLRRRIWLALPFGIAAACLDEVIQMFVPGRGPGILDVAIDTCGVLTGILLLRIGYKLITRRQL